MRDLDYDRLQVVDVPMGAALMVRGELLRELGGLDQGYFMYFEEADLCRRIHGLGHRVYYLPSEAITHLGGESSRPERDALFKVYLSSLFRYVSADLPPWRFRVFAGFFKAGFIVKMAWEIPLNLLYLWRFRRIAPDEHRARVKAAELSRNLRFFERLLGWFLFEL
jgi:GT2 family glycosyltransferase